jgi:FKBP-type peptidyl-prolyl cis-trans isomerase FklB
MSRFHARTPIRTALAWAILSLAASAASAQSNAATPQMAASAAASSEQLAGPPLLTLKDKMSYSTGVMTARQLAKNGVPFDIDLIVQGLRDGMAGGAIRIAEKDMKIVLQSMSAEIQRKLSSERSVKANIARENGLRFAAEFAKKPGVTSLPGGLLVRPITEGKGDKPAELNAVVVRYRGTLVDGSEFDVTPEGKTVTLKLTEVITGFREAMKRMPAGSTWEIVVPPTLAYGNRGSGSVGPNETLVFNVELVAVVQ